MIYLITGSLIITTLMMFSPLFIDSHHAMLFYSSLTLTMILVLSHIYLLIRSGDLVALEDTVPTLIIVTIGYLIISQISFYMIKSKSSL